MSGGSFNYLYQQEEFNISDLEAMADELRRRGMYDAEKATRALIPTMNKQHELLLSLWQAVEWHVSGDWSEAKVARAFVAWEQACKEAEAEAELPR